MKFSSKTIFEYESFDFLKKGADHEGKGNQNNLLLNVLILY